MTQPTSTRDVLIACDFPTGEATLAFLARFGAARPFVKIGMELFYGEGPGIVRALKERGHAVFLDLKLHDIPTTVRRAMANLRALGVDMTNVHAAGGRAMMAAAREGLGDGARLIAVTQLTSTSPETLREELLIVTPMEETVRHYARNARSAGLDGVVCSPLESAGVHAACGADFLAVTPGIRYPEGSADDQARATTPAKARALGSDFIVVGRPITAAADPLAAYKRTRRDFL